MFFFAMFVACHPNEDLPGEYAPEASLTGPVSVIDGFPVIDTPINGQITYQVLWESNRDTGALITASTPFVYMQLSDTKGLWDYGDFFSGSSDACWRNIPLFTLKGSVDLGPKVELMAGDADVTMKRNRGFLPGETIYMYDPIREDILDGSKAGLELVLAGHATGVTIPTIVELNPASWTELLDSPGSIDLQWTPSDDEDVMIWVDLQLYDSNYDYDSILCALVDDGDAQIETGWSGEIAAAELSVARVQQKIDVHPQFGTMAIRAFQNVKFVGYTNPPQP